MTLLRNVLVRGYRSLRSVDLRLDRLNVLIGANGAGKSNFISLFKMLNEMMAGRLQQYIGSAGRSQSILYLGPKVTPQLEMTLEFELTDAVDTYYLRLFHAANDTLVFADETLAFKKRDWPEGRIKPRSLGAGHQETMLRELAKGDDPTSRVFRAVLNGCRLYHFHDTSAAAPIRQYGYVGEDRWLKPDAGNLAAMLYAYRRTDRAAYDRIVSTIQKVMPEFQDFDLGPERLNANEIGLKWRRRGSDYLLGAHQLSDGSLRAMAMITLLLQPEADLPKVLVLDEPELGLHPYALEIVAGLLRAASLRSQVIVATQSPTFLNHFTASEIVVVEPEADGSRFRRLDPKPLVDWLETYSTGELWEKNVLGGGPVA